MFTYQTYPFPALCYLQVSQALSSPSALPHSLLLHSSVSSPRESHNIGKSFSPAVMAVRGQEPQGHKRAQIVCHSACCDTVHLSLAVWQHHSCDTISSSPCGSCLPVQMDIQGGAADRKGWRQKWRKCNGLMSPFSLRLVHAE